MDLYSSIGLVFLHLLSIGIPAFVANDLYYMMCNPKLPSMHQSSKMKDPKNAENRLQDIWIWNGKKSSDIT